MVSGMESDDVLREAAGAADRAEAAPWTEYPPTPAWYPASVGVWSALLVLAFGLPDVVWRVVALLALVAVEGAFIGWYRHYRGVLPSGAPPAEFTRPMAWMLGALVVAVGVVIALALLVAPWAGAIAALVLITAVVWRYEQRYAEAARRVRQRLA